MKYEQLIRNFAKTEDIEFEIAAEFIDTFFSSIKLGLIKDGKVKVSKLGIFSSKTFKSKITKNKETGEPETVPEKILPHFTKSRVSQKSKKIKSKEKKVDMKNINLGVVEKTSDTYLLKKIIILFLIFTVLNIAIMGFIGLSFIKSNYVKRLFNKQISNYLDEKGITYNGISEIVESKFDEVLTQAEKYQQQGFTTIKTELSKLKTYQEESTKKLKGIEETLRKKIEKMISSTAQKRNRKAEVSVILYVVKKNDTLWSLSKRYLNNPYNWVGIYKTNGTKIKNPNMIYPGQKIFIPVIKEKK